MHQSTSTSSGSTDTLKLILAWGFVGIPLLWGVWVTLVNAAQLFR
jgi:hypothetical protein